MAAPKEHASGGPHDARIRGVDAGVDGERGRIDHLIAGDHGTVGVDLDQIAHPQRGERDGERIDPEPIGMLRVARRDVARHAGGEPEAGEQTKARGQALFAVAALGGHVVERRRRDETHGPRN